MFRILTVILCLTLGVSCTQKEAENNKNEKILSIHLLGYTTDSLLLDLEKQLPAIAANGINTIFLEVDYSFEFNTHPELRQGDSQITAVGAKRFASAARTLGVSIIPQFQSFGHQSWANNTFPLLTVYPELDLTPGAFENNENIYCREWNPLDPKVNKIVFPIIDEIIQAFEADAIHLGMDEVFLIDSVQAKTYGMKPASVFAMVVNQFHNHFVKEKKLEMYIWADRLINGNEIKYGAWESSFNETWQALDSIPKDIILADWHYNSRNTYKSIDLFLDKGFRVIPASYSNLSAVKDLINYSYSLRHQNMLGHMFTTWGRKDNIADYKPMLFGLDVINKELFDKVLFKTVTSQNQIALELLSKGADIRFSFDEIMPSIESPSYEKPIVLTESVTINAQAYEGNSAVGEVCSSRFEIHKGLGADVLPNLPISPIYETDQGVQILSDGKIGSQSFSDGLWAGFENDIDIIFDLNKIQSVSTISFRSLVDENNSILAPKSVFISISSDGENYEELNAKVTRRKEDNVVINSMTINPKSARYIRVLASQSNTNKTEKGWLFIDEVVIR